MAYTSGFFDAEDLGNGNYDRAYNASQFAHYFSLFVGNGVFANPTRTLQVFASEEPDMRVSISPGSAWINGYWVTVQEDLPEILPVSISNPTLSRIDSVIAGWSSEDRAISLYIKQGELSSEPNPVALQRDKERYELELAQITVPVGAANITQSQIKDTRQDAERCGIVKGLIEEIDATDLFAQFTDAFDYWFNNIKGVLSGDVTAQFNQRISNLEDGTTPAGAVKTLNMDTASKGVLAIKYGGTGASTIEGALSNLGIAELPSRLELIESKISVLWDAVFTDINNNPFSVTFNTLDGILITAGVYNETSRRLEC